jgi:dihydroneopterin aldolase
VWDTDRSYECVALRDVVVEVRIGAFAEELAGPQTVRVDVELYRQRGAYAGGGLEACLNYDRVFRHLVEVWPRRPHTALLEQLAEDLIAFCLADERVEACRVVIRKPGIYLGRAIPTLEVYRRRDG